MRPIWLGLSDYRPTLDLQLQLHEYVRSTQSNGFLLGLEHPSTITLGKRIKDTRAVLSHNHLPIVFVDRGGEATLHSPGQLVIYPIINFGQLGIPPRTFVNGLILALQKTLLHYGISTSTNEQQPGLYTAAGKIAFAGLRLSQGVSYHGLSLNVFNDITLFNGIISCGTRAAPIDSMKSHHFSGTCLDVFKTFVTSFETEFRLTTLGLAHYSVDELTAAKIRAI